MLAEFDYRKISQEDGLLTVEFLGDAGQHPRGVYSVVVPVPRQRDDSAWRLFGCGEDLEDSDHLETLEDWSQTGIETQIGLAYWTGEATYLGEETPTDEG